MVGHDLPDTIGGQSHDHGKCIQRELNIEPCGEQSNLIQSKRYTNSAILTIIIVLQSVDYSTLDVGHMSSSLGGQLWLRQSPSIVSSTKMPRKYANKQDTDQCKAHACTQMSHLTDYMLLVRQILLSMKDQFLQLTSMDLCDKTKLLQDCLGAFKGNMKGFNVVSSIALAARK